MKLKYIFIAFFTSFLFLCCSIDSSPLNTHIDLGTLVAISDDCDCVYPDGDCYTGYLLPMEEIEIIMDLINQSPDECIYFNSVDSDVEGYVIWLNGYGVI